MTMSMEQIHRIKELQLQQKGPYQIAKELGIDPKTVRKYMEKEDFSPQAPVAETRSSKLILTRPRLKHGWWRTSRTGINSDIPQNAYMSV